MKLSNHLLDKIYITSDTHAFHVNITKGTSKWSPASQGLLPGQSLTVREFNTPQEMTQKIVDNFNSIIPEDGILFHLGDWSFAGRQNIEIFRNMLNVKEIHLITGNHDEHIEKGDYDHLFTSRQKYLELLIGSLQFNLFHFNIYSWNNINRGAFHLHGHHHWKGDKRFSEGKCMDIGVDGNNLKPYKLIDVIDLLKDRHKIDLGYHRTL